MMFSDFAVGPNGNPTVEPKIIAGKCTAAICAIIYLTPSLEAQNLVMKLLWNFVVQEVQKCSNELWVCKKFCANVHVEAIFSPISRL